MLLMCGTRPALLMQAQLRWSGHEILSGLEGARKVEAPGASSHPRALSRMPGTASPAPRVREKACRFGPLPSTYNAGRDIA